MADAEGLAFPKRSSFGPKHPDRLTPEQFRARVWERDGGRDRATGQILYKEHASAFCRGQVCHLKGRRVRPEWKVDPDRAVLLSDENHQLSDARGGRLLRLTDPVTGEPATDASKPIRFTRVDRNGFVMWSRIR